MAGLPVESNSVKSQYHIPEIVLIDDDIGTVNYIRKIVGDNATLHRFSDVIEASKYLTESLAPDLVLLDCNISDGTLHDSALALLAKFHKEKPWVPVVMLSSSGDMLEVLRATQIGAAGFIIKPSQKADIDLVLRQQSTDADDSQVDTMEIPLDEYTSFVRASERMRYVESQCLRVATDIPVLILGESGTGKEIAAKFIHKMSARSRRTFLKVNCAAMPIDLLESELFGYEQGAFTGAVKSKPGKFELCNEGTIFLDEIGEMPSALQAKLLQVLQDGSFSRLGGRTTVKVDVRIIAATNINIKAAMAQKTFREDLYYRLNGFGLLIPPLRERRDEIPILTRYFMRQSASKFGRDPLAIPANLMQALKSYSWPGNLRELDNTVKRYLVLADEQAIINELRPDNPLHSISDRSEVQCDAGGLKSLVRGLKGDAESVMIGQTLQDAGWNKKAAADTLQISYKALLYKIKQYNLIEPERI